MEYYVKYNRIKLNKYYLLELKDMTLHRLYKMNTY